MHCKRKAQVKAKQYIFLPPFDQSCLSRLHLGKAGVVIITLRVRTMMSPGLCRLGLVKSLQYSVVNAGADLRITQQICYIWLGTANATVLPRHALFH